MQFEPVIGLEVHAELETKSKMFCACPVVDTTLAMPNSAVCPVCSGMPGVLPVLNQRAVEYALRVALALECEILPVSIFARKNYFYPDLPKGYQISQYEQPLARNGRLVIHTSAGEQTVRIRRVHLEEDTGKLTHINQEGEAYSLIDLNRAGVPLLEIVTEPDLHSSEAVRAYAMALRSLLRCVGVNSGDMQKGVLRVEPNVSVRPVNSKGLGTRTEIKNLNSFRVLERSVAFEIQRQSDLLRSGQKVNQETRGWDDITGVTVTQRMKEEADDYRYFPEPDLPALVIEPGWLEAISAALPELPAAKLQRFQEQYGLNKYDAGVLTEDLPVSAFFEKAVQSAPDVPAKLIANWISGDLFSLLNQTGLGIDQVKVQPQELAALARLVSQGEINQNSGKGVLAEMFASGRPPESIVAERGLGQISDEQYLSQLVDQVVAENPAQLASYLDGKKTIARWLFGQVMRLTQSRANPGKLQSLLEKKLSEQKKK
jgi:aspartyl-tRNA(Asn)/glutamyl-tRNA(Gln) amidotransferase subunit B